MTPEVRKSLLTVHVVSSVGWLGAVTGFLALSIAAVTSQDAELVRGTYLSMNLIGGWVIVPSSLLSLLSGVSLALATEWGLLKHYWVLVKFILTLLTTIALLLHQFTAVSAAAARVRQASIGAMPAVGQIGFQLVVDASFAFALLLFIAALSVFKPWGMTAYGLSTTQTTSDRGKRALPTGLTVLLAIIGVVVVAFIALHLTGHGLHHAG